MVLCIILHQLPPPTLTYNFLDILWSDGTATQTVRPTSDGVTPIGLCIAPTGFFGANEKARFMSLKYAGGSQNGETVGVATGSTTYSNQYLQWTLESGKTDVPGLTNYNKITSTTGANDFVSDYQGGNDGCGCGCGSTKSIRLYTENGTWIGLESGNELTGYALGDINGKQNTGIISALGSLSNYPVFASVLNYYTAGTQASDWYLPALGELAIVCANQSRINPVLSNISSSYGSDCMSSIADDNKWYWSSTEYDSNEAFIIEPDGRSGGRISGQIVHDRKSMPTHAIPMLQK